MAHWKRTLAIAALVTAAFLAGVAVSGGFFIRRFQIDYRDRHYLEIMECAVNAHEVRADQKTEFLDRMERAMAWMLRAADSQYGDLERRLPSFWAVQRYYEKYDLPIPEEIQPILAKLPPRPPTSCELKAREQDQ